METVSAAQNLEVGKRHIKLIVHKIQFLHPTYTFISVSIRLGKAMDNLDLNVWCIPCYLLIEYFDRCTNYWLQHFGLVSAND